MASKKRKTEKNFFNDPANTLTDSSVNNKPPKSGSNSNETAETYTEAPGKSSRSFLKNDVFYIMPVGIGKVRLNLFKTQIKCYEGEAVNEFSEAVTHVLIEDSVADDIEKLRKVVPKYKQKNDQEHSSPLYVKISWLSQCLKNKERVSTSKYELQLLDYGPSTSKHIQLPVRNTPHLEVNQESEEDATIHNSDRIIAHSNDEAGSSQLTRPRINMSKFVCATASSEKRINYNEHITDKLEALVTAYKTTKDHWRALGYEKAISVLKNHPKQITTWQEAKALPHVGERLADKILEIIESGTLRKMEEVCSDEKVEAMNNYFINVWGVGPTTAQYFVQQGFRTLKDLEEKADLNRQQKIGLKHYYDFLEKIPRDEVTEISRVVETTALSIQPGLTVITCGSYRRGKEFCGDVDVLVTHRDGVSHRGLLIKLLAPLHVSGFLTDDLVANEVNGNHHKYLGVCKLVGNGNKHRRLDIIIVPYSEFACALIYFTGSAHFNRSMRLLAKKKGMRLTEHSLNAGVIRANVKGADDIFDGQPLPTPTEESVFEHLGLKYRKPEERDH